MATPTGFPIIISQHSMDYILNQEQNKEKLMVVLAQDELNPDYKPVADELERLRDIYIDKINFVRIFCKSAPEMAGNYGVVEYPTIFVIKDKIKVDESVGLDPKPLEGMVRKWESTVINTSPGENN